MLGVGGSAAHAGHAVNDFRKLCGFEAYAPTDNVSELTARMNDEGWETAYVEWLKGSRLGTGDAVLVFSVGGGNVETNLSGNLIAAIDSPAEPARASSAIVGRDGGYAKKAADASVVIPPLVAEHVTPHTEGLAPSSGTSSSPIRRCSRARPSGSRGDDGGRALARRRRRRVSR